MQIKKFRKLAWIFMVFVTILFLSCDGSATKNEENELSLEESITKMENEFFTETQTKMDKRKALDLIKLYSRFAEKYPNDPKSAEYLFKASDLSMNLNRPAQTIKLFDQILTSYPAYDKSSSALFLKAFVYEDQLKDYDSARKYYELFLVKYPDSEFADDAIVSLQNLGKSPEELIREFEEKNK